MNENDELTSQQNVDGVFTLTSLNVKLALGAMTSEKRVKEDKGSSNANGMKVSWNIRTSTQITEQMDSIMGSHRLVSLVHDVRDMQKIPFLGKQMPESIIMSTLEQPNLIARIRGLRGVYVREAKN